MSTFAIALLFVLNANALKSGDPIPNQFVIKFPTTGVASFEESGFNPQSRAAIVSAYSKRMANMKIKVLQGMKKPGSDWILVNATEAAARNLTALGAEVFPNRVVTVNGFARTAPWGLTVSFFRPISF